MAEQETMQQEWIKRGTPGKEHQMLARHEGEWNVILRTWMNPDEPPSENKGTASYKMILGGRVLVEDFRGDFQGMPFEGHGMIGYDNNRGRWWQTWNDNMSTAIFKGEGTAGPDGKTITMTGKSDRPDRKDVESKGVYHFASDNEHTFETYEKGPDGKERKTMEIHYRRK
ncbi:MAG TPA: DUF1579 domain-containing protein [bacterium]|jgi:hypothetical protein